MYAFIMYFFIYVSICYHFFCTVFLNLGLKKLGKAECSQRLPVLCSAPVNMAHLGAVDTCRRKFKGFLGGSVGHLNMANRNRLQVKQQQNKN